MGREMEKQMPRKGECTLSPNRLALAVYRPDPDRETSQRPLEAGLICRLAAYTQPYAAQRNWLLCCVLLRAVQLPCVAWGIAAIINGPIAHQASAGKLVASVLALLAWMCGTQFTFHFRQRLALELGEAVVHDLRQAIFSHLQQMPMRFFNQTKIGRIISRVTSDCEAIRIGVQDVLFVSLVGVGQMVVAAALMLWYDRAMFGVVAAMTPILWWLNRRFRCRLSQAYRDVQESFSRVTSTLAEAVTGMRITQSYVRQEVNAALFHDLVADHAHYNMAVTKAAGAFLPLLEFNSQFFVAALLVIGGYRVLTPEASMTPSDLIQFFFLANIFFNPIQALGTQYNQALTAMAGAERVFRLLDTEPADESSAAIAVARGLAGTRSCSYKIHATPDTTLAGLRGRVEFRHVTFGYHPGRPVLRDISFTAEPGQTVALVGHTGSGKTSILSLIAKFYTPDAGDLLLDGIPLRDVDADRWHHQMGLVLQHNFLFTGTVLDNIRVGRPQATVDEVLAALCRLDCQELVLALPGGLHAQVGERGSHLSLGQRQLVCFARAMLADPRILILDEATSAVDTLTETKLQRALSQLLRERTSFVVAHRLSTIRHADLVLVLDQGQLVERGTHDQLMAQAGVYASLSRQFSRGRGEPASSELAEAA